MHAKNRRIFRYWAVGVFFLVVAWIAYHFSLIIFGGLLTILTRYANPNVASVFSLVIIIFGITVVPYMIGRVLLWVVSQEILIEKLETHV